MIISTFKDFFINLKSSSGVMVFLISFLITSILIIIQYWGSNLGNFDEHPVTKWFLRIITIASLSFGCFILISDCTCVNIKRDNLNIIFIMILMILVLIILRFYYEFACDAVPMYKYPNVIYILLLITSVLIASLSIGLICTGGVMILANVLPTTNVILLIIGVVLMALHLGVCFYWKKKSNNDASI